MSITSIGSIEILFSEETIKNRVKEMGEQITSDYKGLTVTLIGTLKGSVYFLSDLSRELNLNQEIEFVKASSYGLSSVSSGDVKIDFATFKSLKDKHVLCIEDIVDTGSTVSYLGKYLLKMEPASLKLASLLNKPSRRKVYDINIDYLGFNIPDEFVVGYGLDYAEKYRNLKYIGILDSLALLYLR